MRRQGRKGEIETVKINIFEYFTIHLLSLQLQMRSEQKVTDDLKLTFKPVYHEEHNHRDLGGNTVSRKSVTGLHYS